MTKTLPKPREAAKTARGDRSQADAIIEQTYAMAFFHNPDGEAFVDLPHFPQRETLPVRSPAFARRLRHLFYEAHNRSPDKAMLERAIDTLEAQALCDGDEAAVALRVARNEENVFIDRGERDDFRIIHVDVSGWRYVDDCDVRFIRNASTSPLCPPSDARDVRLLRKYVNLADEDEFVLLVCWLTAALAGVEPHPILILNGEQGSAKSTTTRILKRLIDPSPHELRSFPRSEHELMLAAQRERVLAFDNLSGVPSAMSDALCRLASGGAFACRKLYSSDEETILRACRPVILNGIDDLAGRADLASRAIVLRPPAIADDDRRLESEVFEDFAFDAPKILSALLDGIVEGLKGELEDGAAVLSRMADFAAFARAAQRAFFPEGAFERAYRANAAETEASAFEAEPLGEAIIRFMASQDDWTGTATELLKALERWRPHRSAHPGSQWPQSANALSNKLTRLAGGLRERDLAVERSRSTQDRARAKLITIRRKEACKSSSASSAPAKDDENDLRNNGLVADDLRTILPEADGPDRSSSARSSAQITNENNTLTDADDADDLFQGVCGEAAHADPAEGADQ